MLVNDIRFAVRGLGRSRTFTITALATLALGISVNTAIFSVIDSVLLRQPPFDAPERIVTVDGQNPAQGMQISSVAYPDVIDWREAFVAVELEGRWTRGATVVDLHRRWPEHEPNANVAMTLDVQRYWDLILANVDALGTAG